MGDDRPTDEELDRFQWTTLLYDLHKTNPAFQHTAFKVRSLADFRPMYQRVLGRDVPVKMALNHGASIAFYFEDPEGHLVEFYWPTGVACRQPHGEPIDLMLSDEALRRDVAELTARVGAPAASTGWRGTRARRRRRASSR